MSRTSTIEKPPARSGFCNPGFVFGIGRDDYDDSHARCHLDDCPCPHHLDPGWRMTPAQRKTAEALSEQLKMPVVLDDRMPEGTFMVGSFDHGVRMMQDAHVQATEDALAPYAEDLAAGRVVLEQVEPLRIEQVPAEPGDDRVRVVATETIRLRLPSPAELAARLLKVTVTE